MLVEKMVMDVTQVFQVDIGQNLIGDTLKDTQQVHVVMVVILMLISLKFLRMETP
jgi:hypothetical protein